MTQAATYQVTASHFCAGLLVRNGVCVKAAPIVAWARGKRLRDIQTYCERRGWFLEYVGEYEED